jgi:argininosuccinate lyase
MKLWEKGVNTSSLINEFTSGRDREIDLYLAESDVLGSIAHARMLEKISLISKSELASLEKELRKIHGMIMEGDFIINDDVEDVHSQIEFMLTDALGDTGKKIHTARSRNDQVLLDMKLFARDKIREVVYGMQSLFNVLIGLSNEHREILMPGYSHMQIAMPSSFGLWFGAFAESLTDDMILLQSAYRIINQNPLGSAAGYGSSFPVDRDMTTKLLGFDSMHVNVVNAQMNRGKMERTVAFALGSVGSTLSRLAMDICLFSGQNFRFFRLPDEFTTGSSIMPHKKNPDVFELIRAKGNKLLALSYEISLIGSNLPSGYHRDFQLIKENFIPSFDLLLEMISVTGKVIGNIKINQDVINDPLYQDIYSVEEVNRLVIEGMSFREAYRQVAANIADGTYRAQGTPLVHSHAGSIGNLCNERITEKIDHLVSGFNFSTLDNVRKNLLS